MANHFDDPKDPPPYIDLAVVGVVNGDDMRLCVTVAGKLQRYRVRPHVAATIITKLAEGLAAGTEVRRDRS